MGFKHTGLFPEQAVNWVMKTTAAGFLAEVESADSIFSVKASFQYIRDKIFGCNISYLREIYDIYLFNAHTFEYMELFGESYDTLDLFIEKDFSWTLQKCENCRNEIIF